jgi:hypothetical protein
MKLPEQLCDTSFRFYLIGTESKIPCESLWTTKNNYHFFDPKLLNHQGNYGVATGHGNLIVLDFDSKPYYDSVKSKLPKTFTVLSAGRQLPHLYYILTDKMIKKTNIKDDKDNVLLDIQAQGSGVVGPGSFISRRFYSVKDNLPIAEITVAQLKEVFHIQEKYKNDSVAAPGPDKEQHQFVVDGLLRLGIKRKKGTLFECPFHDSSKGANLNVMPNGFIYCFHEVKCWHTLHQFIQDYNKFRGKLQ